MRYNLFLLSFLYFFQFGYAEDLNLTDSAMVVTAHPIATKIGLEVLKMGGNAFDAMLAVHFTLAVVYQRAGNLGGGGFMVCRLNNGNVYSLDFREEAPSEANEDLFLDENGNVIPGLSLETHLACGVPGSVDGVLTAHERFGRIPYRYLLQPAIDLAENGFPLTEKEADVLNSYLKDMAERNGPTVWTSREKWSAGDVIRIEDLAQTIRRIQEFGRDGFYKGETAQFLLEEINSGNGIMSAEDLSSYESVWREPLVGYYDEYKIISMAPPSSGGVTLLQILKMIEDYPIHRWGPENQKTVHLLVEAEKRAYADRARHLGDPDFYNVPMHGLLNNYYLGDRMLDFRKRKASPSSAIDAGEPPVPESVETTHYSIVDRFGNAVSVTTTLNARYGSKILVEGAGFFLNNEMDDFSAKPGVPNLYGLIGGEANKVEGSKRMLSSMTPTIVEKEGELFIVLGSPGGSTIITTVLQVILNVVEHEMEMQEAVDRKRYHHQWMPDVIFCEEGIFDPKLTQKLGKWGHEFQYRDPIGSVDAILVDDEGILHGGADSRGDDTA